MIFNTPIFFLFFVVFLAVYGLLLNAILWSAKADVPEGGVESTVTEADLQANLDPKPGQGLPEAAPKGKKGK